MYSLRVTILSVAVLTILPSLNACPCQETQEELICQSDFAGIVNLKSWKNNVEQEDSHVEWIFDTVTLWVNHSLSANLPHTFTTEESGSECNYNLKRGTYFMAASFRDHKHLGMCNSVIEEWNSVDKSKEIKTMLDNCSQEKGFVPSKFEEYFYPIGRHDDSGVTAGVHNEDDIMLSDERHSENDQNHLTEGIDSGVESLKENRYYQLILLIVNMVFFVTMLRN